MSDSGVRAAIGARTLAEAFRITAAGREGAVAIRTRGDEGREGLVDASPCTEDRVTGFDVAASSAALEPDDVLSIIYTSGTTGPPKGVMLSHRNLMTAVEAVEAMVRFPQDGRVISWLPSAHVAERVAHHYLPIVYGLQITCCPNPREVLQYLPEVQPTWFFAVPRIWEK